MEKILNKQINSIKVEGFKNITNSKIEFKNISALVSLNGFGKSNLLSATKFGIDFIKSDENTRLLMMGFKYGIPILKSCPSKDYKFEVEMELKNNKSTFLVLYGFSFKWARADDKGSYITSEWLKVKEAEKGSKYNTYIKRNTEESHYKSSESGRCDVRIPAGPGMLVISKLRAFDNLFYYEILNAINDLEVYIERHFDASKSYKFRPFMIKGRDIMQINDDSNIPRIVYKLKQDYPDKFELLQNAFLLLMPQMTDVFIKRSEDMDISASLDEKAPIILFDDVIKLFVKDKYLNQPIEFELLSDGAKRIFSMLTCLLLADLNGVSLLAIEEPENSIHPGLLQSYLTVISQLMGDCRIVVTSHSPYIIQYLDLTDIYIGLPGETGAAGFFKFNRSKVKSFLKIASDYNMSTGEFIFELMSGSDEEIKELKEYLV